MATIDKTTRNLIVEAVSKASMEVNEMYTEQWLTAIQLCEAIPMFSPEWLKRYGRTIPRERISVKDANGVEHNSGWCYPKKRILRMIHEGRLRDLKMPS